MDEPTKQQTEAAVERLRRALGLGDKYTDDALVGALDAVIPLLQIGKPPLRMEVLRLYSEQTTVISIKTVVLSPVLPSESNVSRISVDLVDHSVSPRDECLLSPFTKVGDKFDFTLVHPPE